MNCVGWDIGGAHVKMAYIHNQQLFVDQRECPLWKGLNELETILILLLKKLPDNTTLHHVTMTGELVDIFKNRQEGVSQIIETFSRLIPDNHTVKYFSQNGFLHKPEAIRNYQDVASANWIASGKCVSEYCDNAIFVDIGSTTTDILEISNGKLQLEGLSDYERLRSGELVYTGVVRSCVNTITREVNYKGDKIPLIAEQFAVTADVYRILEKLPDNADLGNTMDGEPKDRQSSLRRLARMLGVDYKKDDENEWVSVANEISQQQVNIIMRSLDRLLQNNSCATKIVGAGVGRFLLENISDQLSLPYTDFVSTVFSEEITIQANAADCAPAVALLVQ